MRVSCLDAVHISVFKHEGADRTLPGRLSCSSIFDDGKFRPGIGKPGFEDVSEAEMMRLSGGERLARLTTSLNGRQG